MLEHLELFARRGRGWDSHGNIEIFLIQQLEGEAENVHRHWLVKAGAYRWRLAGIQVIAAIGIEAEAIALRDKLFAIGVDAYDRIEAEMYRPIEKFAARGRGP